MASSVACRAHPSLKDRSTMLTRGCSIAYTVTQPGRLVSGVVPSYHGGADLLSTGRARVSECWRPSGGSMTTFQPNEPPAALSIGILAWNEQDSIRPMLESLLRQSVFGHLWARGEGCEIVCLANGCTDGTVAAAQEVFEKARLEGRLGPGTTARVVDIPEPGRNNAWNRFVHEISDRKARLICFMD